MLPGNRSPLIAGALPVVIVIALSAIAALAISAWLVHQIARQAIDKADPATIAPIIQALGSLLNPLQTFLPWRHPSGPGLRPPSPAGTQQARTHTGDSPEPPQEASDAH